jgi:hypothetical protein
MQHHCINTIYMCLVSKKNPVSLMGICVLYRRDPLTSIVIAKTSPDLCGRRNLRGVKSQLWMSGLNRLQPPTVNRRSWTRLRVP